MNSTGTNLFSIYNSGSLMKYAFTFVFIALLTKIFLYKQLKKIYKIMFKKTSKLKHLIESKKTTTLDLSKN